MHVNGTPKKIVAKDKVFIPKGTGLVFHLFIGLKVPSVVASTTYPKMPTWKILTNDLIEFCVSKNIPLGDLAEHGTIQQGSSRAKLPACSIEIIAEYLLTSKKKK